MRLKSLRCAFELVASYPDFVISLLKQITPILLVLLYIGLSSFSFFFVSNSDGLHPTSDDGLQHKRKTIINYLQR